MNYNWMYNHINPFAKYEYDSAGISELLSNILYNRGYSAKDYEIIDNSFFDLANYYTENIPYLNAAAKRINRAFLDETTEVFVFSDYDTDGITSAAIFNDFIQTLGVTDNRYHRNYSIYVPERKEGYGLSAEWCENVVKNKEEDKNYLVITFDNGITKNEQIKYLNKNGIETVIIDHHEPGFEVPSGIVVDPKKDGERVGDELCGAGLAWVLMYQIYKLYSINAEKEKQQYIKTIGLSLQRCLDYAAIGTIGDMMNMTLFNLSLVKTGLKHINDKNDKNKSALYELVNCFGLREVTSKDIGFNISAAINACGQMGNANLALDMFLKKDEIDENVEDIIRLYNKSKDETKRAKKQLDKQIDELKAKDSVFDIVVMKDIAYGIAGKLSNYVCTNTGRPCVILVDDGEEELKGSGRCANPTINILDLLKEAERKELIKYAAGHSAACGVCFYKDKIEEANKLVNEKLLDMIETDLVDINPSTNLYIDYEIDVKDINLKNYLEINKMPYSMNFGTPNLLLRGYILGSRFSQNNHNNICYTIGDMSGSSIDIWVWNKKADEFREKEPKKIAIVGNMVRNFLNPSQITLDVVDLKFS